MKKILEIVFTILVIATIVLLNLTYNKNSEPLTYYKVYLDGEVLGTINSKAELEQYINNEQIQIKENYNIDEVYIPNGIEIKRELSYGTNVDTVESVYEKIKQKSNFTVRGYQITIGDNNTIKKIYVLDKNTFQEAVEMVLKTYVGTEKYEKYKNDTQEQIKTTGAYITDIYVDNEITIKEMNVSTNEKIYMDVASLSKYLLFGESTMQQTYTVKAGDTIEQIAYDYEISVEEFFISNPKYKKITNILSVGEEVVIAMTNPQINVTLVQENTQDVESLYKTIEKTDSTLMMGYESVTQQGANGIIRVTQYEKIVNGTVNYVKQISEQTIKATTDKIVLVGSKSVPYVGDLKNWYWPVDSYSISSGYSYRINPFTGTRELHGALDISASMGSKIYAANNGVVQTMGRLAEAGIYVIINHNNGYYTQYNHMSGYVANLKVGQTVERGQTIGYVGMTGAATGPHLHFAVWYGGTAYRGIRINPWTLYR